jgi:hypothetical protein
MVKQAARATKKGHGYYIIHSKDESVKNKERARTMEHGSEAYLLQDERHGLAGGGHGGRDEHRDGDSLRVPLHGQREALAAEAMADEDRSLPGRKRSHRVQERAAVVLEGRHVLAAHGAGAAPRHVERRDAVARGGQERGHLVPAPRAVAGAVHQHEVVLVLRRRPLAVLLLLRRRRRPWAHGEGVNNAARREEYKQELVDWCLVVPFLLNYYIHTHTQRRNLMPYTCSQKQIHIRRRFILSIPFTRRWATVYRTYKDERSLFRC